MLPEWTPATDRIITMATAEVKSDAVATGSEMPRPIQFLRAMIADRVPARLGADSFVLGMVIVDQQDRLFWQRPVGLYIGQLSDLCGFPRSNTRRAREARAAMMGDGWLRCQVPLNGDRSQAVYEMILKPISDPSQNGVGDDPTQAKMAHDPSQFGSAPKPKWLDTQAKMAHDPSQFGCPSIPINPLTLNTPLIPNTPLPPKGELFDSGKDSESQSKAPKVDQSMVDQIYQAYPRKVQPKPAKTAIAKALKTIAADDLLGKVKAYAAAKAGSDPQYIPYPATWFNAESWNDDPAEWSRRTTTTGSSRPSLAGTPGQVHQPTARASNDTSRFR